MATDFKEEVKNHLFKRECISCGSYLFLINFLVVDNKRAKGTVHCPDCNLKMNSVFHRE